MINSMRTPRSTCEISVAMMVRYFFPWPSFSMSSRNCCRSSINCNTWREWLKGMIIFIYELHAMISWDCLFVCLFVYLFVYFGRKLCSLVKCFSGRCLVICLTLKYFKFFDCLKSCDTVCIQGLPNRLPDVPGKSNFQNLASLTNTDW